MGACGEGHLEAVTTIQGICTDELRLAVLVTIENPNDLPIDEVTAERAEEEACFLENRSHLVADEEDAGPASKQYYSCWEQGVGRYTVRVKSDGRTWSEIVPVPGNSCHVTKVKKLTIKLD